MARRVKILVFLLLAVAVPATAQTFGFSIGASAPQACLSIGNATYRVATNLVRADVTVRIDPAAVAPDIRIQMAEVPDEADFVLVDDGDAPPACQHSPSASKNVKIDAAATAPDLVVGFATASAPADYRIYVRSRFLPPEIVAALFAAARGPARTLAGRAPNSSN